MNTSSPLWHTVTSRALPKPRGRDPEIQAAIPYLGWRTESALSCVFDHSFFGVERERERMAFDGVTPSGRHPNAGQTLFKLFANDHRTPG